MDSKMDISFLEPENTFDLSCLKDELENIKSKDTQLEIFSKMVSETYNTIKTRNRTWESSKWKDLIYFDNDTQGGLGEKFIENLCKAVDIDANIDGKHTKRRGGGEGDGFIDGKTVEIKTARRSNDKSGSFQHELGEDPWKANFMLFLDIDYDVIYITFFPNFTEEHYKGKNKCKPYICSRSVTHRKDKGAFKIDTTEKINKDNVKNNKFTFVIDDKFKETDFEAFMTRILNLQYPTLYEPKIEETTVSRNEPKDKKGKDDEILNPKTNRYVKKDGKIGKKLLKQL